MPDLLMQLSDYARQLDDEAPPLQSFVAPVVARPSRPLMRRPMVVLVGAAAVALLLVGLPLLITGLWGDAPPAEEPTVPTLAPSITTTEAVAPTTAVELFALEAPGGLSSAVAWNPDGSLLATAIHGEVKVWDASAGEMAERQELDHIEGAENLLWSPDGTRIAINGGGSALGIYDAATGAELLGDLGDRALAWSPDGSRLVVGGAWGWSAVIDAATGEELLMLPLCGPGPYSWVSAAAWSPEGTQIATTCQASVTIWDPADGNELLKITSDFEPPYAGDGVTDIEWSPDGTRIATASDERQIPEVWDTVTGNRLVTLASHAGGVWAIAWSPDGTRIATASADGTAVIWDADSGAELITLTDHAGPVTDVEWSPDGTRVATAGDDGTLRIWKVG